jgi:integrase/recombinase XerC
VPEHLLRLVNKSRSSLESSLEEFLLSREAERCTPKTMTHYRYTVGHFLEWLTTTQHVTTLADIRPTHIRAYLVDLQRRGLKDTTQHAHARGIRCWLNWLVEEGELEASPMRRVAMPRLEARIPAPFSTEDVRRLLAACDRDTATGARNYAMCLALLDSGLRASEFASLRVGDVDPRSGLLVVMGKGGKQRQTRLGAKARQAIARMLRYRPGVGPGDALWAVYSLAREAVGALTAHGMQVCLRRL